MTCRLLQRICDSAKEHDRTIAVVPNHEDKGMVGSEHSRFLGLFYRSRCRCHDDAGRLADLHGLPFVLRKNCEVLNEGKRVFLAEQAQPHITCRTDNDSWALTMVRNNLAAAILAETVTEEGTVSIPIVDFGLVRTVACVWREHSEQETVQTFTAFAAQDSWRGLAKVV